MTVEADIEDYLTRRARELGGWAFKLVPASFVGLPDRIVLMPGGRVGFLELKAPGRPEPRPNQKLWLDRLHNMGFLARWCSSYRSVDLFLEELRLS